MGEVGELLKLILDELRRVRLLLENLSEEQLSDIETLHMEKP